MNDRYSPEKGQYVYEPVVTVKGETTGILAKLDAGIGEEKFVELLYKKIGETQYELINYEGFGGISVFLYDTEMICKIGQNLVRYGKPYVYFVELYGENHRYLDFEEEYLGLFESPKAFIDYRLEELGVFEKVDNILGNLSQYIDTESIAKQWFMTCYCAVEKAEGCHVFSR